MLLFLFFSFCNRENIYGFNLLDDSDENDFYEVAPTSQVFHQRYLQRDFSLPESTASLRASFIKSKRWIDYCWLKIVQIQIKKQTKQNKKQGDWEKKTGKKFSLPLGGWIIRESREGHFDLIFVSFEYNPSRHTLCIRYSDILILILEVTSDLCGLLYVYGIGL